MNEVKYNYSNFNPEYYNLSEFPGPKAGDNCINVELHDLDGRTTSIAEFLDKPVVAFKALIQGGLVAVWDFIKSIPGLLRLHKESNEYYLSKK